MDPYGRILFTNRFARELLEWLEKNGRARVEYLTLKREKE